MTENKKETKQFKDLGLSNEVLKVIQHLGYKQPTPIQGSSIPIAVQKRDIIGIAQTGSGKTASFLLPMLHHLINEKEKKRPYFAVIVEPTRELAAQVAEVLNEMSKAMPGLSTCLLVGGMEMAKQSIHLMKRPHVVVATPGRIVDHLKNTQGFKECLQNLQFFVIDEADKLLDMDFANDLDYLIEQLPKQRTSMLFSATMSTKVEKLQRASLKHPTKIMESEQKYETVDTLRQECVVSKLTQRDGYLLKILQSI